MNLHLTRLTVLVVLAVLAAMLAVPTMGFATRSFMTRVALIDQSAKHRIQKKQAAQLRRWKLRVLRLIVPRTARTRDFTRAAVARDSDRDGLTDKYENRSSKTSPTKADTDGDGLGDGYEVLTSHTNPLKADSDGDGLSDRQELLLGYDPLNAASPPPLTATPPPDTVAPSVAVSAPTAGASVSGTVSVSASASDTGGVAGVRFRADGQNIGVQDTTAPYSVVWDTSAVSTGSHTLTAVAADAAGNTATSDAVNVTVPDTTAPETTISSGPSGTVSSNTASFSFSSSEPGSTFECRLDSGAWSPCSSPASYSALANASHTFEVRASDSAGNTDSTPASRTWTVSSDPPTAEFTITPGPSNTGEQVTFDWTGSCPDSPCSFEWEDEGPDGPGGTDYSWGTTDPFAKAFQVAGTKYVHLVVTDAKGRTAEARQQLTVQEAAAAPPPPPSPQCSDGQDNDGDGKVDLGDPGCSAATDDSEGDDPPPSSGACQLNATPSNFGAQVSAATAGQTVCLASGDYGTWTGVNKPITVRRADGATPRMKYQFGAGDAGFTLDGMSDMWGDVNAGAANITVRNSEFDDRAGFSGAMTNVLFEDNVHMDQFCPAGDWNMRLHLNSSGVTVRDSLFQGGDCDGIFISGNNNLVENNRFVNLCESGPNHTDGLQFADPGDPSGGYNTTVRRNFFQFNACNNGYAQALTSFDSGTKGALIEDNVVDTTRPNGIEIYSDEGSTIRHNTVRYYGDAQCAFSGIVCGGIDITRKSDLADPSSVGTQVYDNVGIVRTSYGTTLARNDHNASGALATYVGPLNTWAGFHLAGGSAGLASDGLDVGIR